jgi:LPS export ABC transporter protein LptC
MAFRTNISNLLKLLVFPGVFCLVACENDIERINSLTNTSNLPEISGKKVEILYSDSGKVKMQLNADEVQQFGKAERPYIEFPKGIHVIFFDDSLKTESEIIADYAKYYQNEKLWEAHGNVIAQSKIKGQKLNSEELFWDENAGRIYSNSFSRIENKDGIFYGQKGFETNQKFSPLRLKSSRGTVNIKDEPQKVASGGNQ